jgi:chemotaxis protein methyltransferase CheR
MAPSAAELQRLASVISRRTGMAFPASRLPFLSARARAVMAWAGADNWDSWLSELETAAGNDDNVCAVLEEALQVHETCFFRYPNHHALLSDVVLPASSTAGAPRLRILSVGCSTGQEPYSLAMTVRENLDAGTARQVEILGVDVGRAALAAARRGVYGPLSVASVPPLYLERYFQTEGAAFTVRPEVRAMVRLLRHDIRRELYLGKFDAIFCCNVCLYFMRPTKDQILARLTAALRRGGYLFLGHAEGVTPPGDNFRAIHRPSGVVFQRIPA